MASRRSRLIVPHGGMSRRQFLARSAALGAAGVSLPAFLAACGGSSDGGSDSSGAGSLFFENWPEYIDLTDGDVLGTVDRFIEATGISMEYSDLYNDNNEYFAKIQPLLGAGQGGRRTGGAGLAARQLIANPHGGEPVRIDPAVPPDRREAAARARRDLCLLVLNLNEFLHVD